jgi:crotonobetainyl-CoA:carnitine CoA-transferase CaiB-like acyl-CoA transferase
MPIFQHLRIIELASVLAGPSVGMFFAELGAEVIKVENPTLGGDVTRTWRLKKENKTGISAYFSAVNWGKKSIALDLKQAQDRAIVYELVKTADMVISSFLPGTDKKMGMDAATLMSYNPKLICGEINGYGADVERAAFDAIIQAESGFTYINGEGNAIYKMPVALMDVLAAHQLKEAMLLAYIEREQTGKGKRVSVSLIESGLASLINQATNYLVANHIPQAIGSDHPNIVPYGTIYYSLDNKPLVLAIGNDNQFAHLCQILAIDVNDDISTNPQRVSNREIVHELLQKAIRQHNRQELLQQLIEAKIPVGAVNNMQEVFEMPIAQNLFIQSPHSSMRGVRSLIAQGIEKESSLSLPPDLDANRQEILAILSDSHK